MIKFKEFLNEKIIQFNSGAKYDNIVILAGGAASGKGFGASNFLRKENYKVFDVDELKKELLKIAKLKNKYPEIRNLDLKKPEDVLKLHMFIKERGFKNARILSFLKSAGSSKFKPNILFDITLKNTTAISTLIPKLLEYGYKPKNINIVWILSDYKIALKRNRERERIVKDDILLTTHSGAKSTMTNLISKSGGKWINSKFIDGEIYVILNNNDETWFLDKQGKETKDLSKARKSRDFTIKESGAAWTPQFGKVLTTSFTSLQIKKSGKSIISDDNIKKTLFSWIIKNAPTEAK